MSLNSHQSCAHAVFGSFWYILVNDNAFLMFFDIVFKPNWFGLFSKVTPLLEQEKLPMEQHEVGRFIGLHTSGPAFRKPMLLVGGAKYRASPCWQTACSQPRKSCPPHGCGSLVSNVLFLLAPYSMVRWRAASLFIPICRAVDEHI